MSDDRWPGKWKRGWRQGYEDCEAEIELLKKGNKFVLEEMMIDETELLRLLRSGCAVTPHQIQAAELIERLLSEADQEEKADEG